MATHIADAVRDYLQDEAGISTDEVPAGEESGSSGPRKRFRRPNGEEYLGRAVPENSLGASDDVELLRACREAGIFVRLHSPPGTGKSAALEAAFGDLITVGISEGTDEDKLLGGYRPDPADPAGFRFQKGPVYRALEEGRPIVFDEVNAAQPRVMSRLNALSDGRGEIAVEEHEGEIVAAAAGYWSAITYNAGVVGFELSPALESRYAFAIEYTTDLAAARELGVPEKAIELAKRLYVLRREAEISWAPEMRELLCFRRLGQAFGAEYAARNLVGQAPEDDREAVATEVESRFGETAARAFRL